MDTKTRSVLCRGSLYASERLVYFHPIQMDRNRAISIRQICKFCIHVLYILTLFIHALLAIFPRNCGFMETELIDFIIVIIDQTITYVRRLVLFRYGKTLFGLIWLKVLEPIFHIMLYSY